MQPLTFGQEPMTAIAAAATAVENAMDALLGAVQAALVEAARAGACLPFHRARHLQRRDPGARRPPAPKRRRSSLVRPGWGVALRQDRRPAPRGRRAHAPGGRFIEN